MALGLALAQPYGRTVAWAPSRLFAASEKGIAYDLSDKSTLYQDSARTTLVSASGDPIGSVTDLSPNVVHASQATTASKPLWNSGGYGSLDGVDDWLATAAIDLTGTAKVTVVVSMRKVGEAGIGSLIESRPSFTTPGSFGLHAPSAAAAGDYRIASTGSNGGADAGFVYGDTAAASSPAPITQVISAAFDASVVGLTGLGPLRLDGQAAALTKGGGASSAGTFGNLALSFGRRNGASLPFNGRIYRMIVIGRALTAAELAQAEAWCAAPAGVVLP